MKPDPDVILIDDDDETATSAGDEAEDDNGDGVAGGYLSDESNFYGDSDTKAELNSRLKDYDPLTYWQSRDRGLQRQTAVAREKDGVDAISKTSSASASSTKGSSRQPKSTIPVQQSKLLTTSSSLSYSKISPQKAAAALESSKTSPPITSDEEAPFNPREGFISARQLNESVPEFLKRLPPSTTTLSDIGPWIWIHNPYSSYRPLNSDVATLKTDGETLLRNYMSHRHSLESAYKSSNAATLTRKLKPHLLELQTDLFALARRTGVTSGKWMLFPPAKSVDHIWQTIAQATADGTLGYCAKVATRSDDEEPSLPAVATDTTTVASGLTTRPRLICVYTTDFSDKQEIHRVLQRLRTLGLVNDSTSGSAVYYKADAWTYLGIASGNEWKLKASLYGSLDGDMR